MNTKQRNRLKRKMQAYNASKAATNVPIDAKTGEPLADLISTMQAVDTKSKEAKANEESMDDNNGGIIWYNWLWKTLKGEEKDNKK